MIDIDDVDRERPPVRRAVPQGCSGSFERVDEVLPIGERRKLVVGRRVIELTFELGTARGFSVQRICHAYPLTLDGIDVVGESAVLALEHLLGLYGQTQLDGRRLVLGEPHADMGGADERAELDGGQLARLVVHDADRTERVAVLRSDGYAGIKANMRGAGHERIV